MTREQAIQNWKVNVNAVFHAENKLMPEWIGRLGEAKFHGQEEIERVCDAFVTAIATEIVSRTTDEELSKLEE